MKFSCDKFLSSISDFDDIKVVDLLTKMRFLSSDERKALLDNDIIRNKIKNNILKESPRDEWRYYRDIMNYNLISIKELLSILGGKYIKEFYDNNRDKYEYIFFGSLCEKNPNDVVEMCLNDIDLFKEFYKELHQMDISKLGYDNVLNIINLVKEINGDDYYFLRCINEKYQYELLKESLDDNTIIGILNYCDRDVVQFFIDNDDRFNRLYDKLDIYDFRFSQEFLHNHINFIFDKLKDKSLVSFRYNIDNFSKINGSLELLEMFDKYEDDIINSFDIDSGMFLEYKRRLDNEENIFGSKYYIDIEYSFRKLDFSNNDSVISFLKEMSILKLSEVVIDYLFKDNIYNVRLNIGEMIRYNSFLNDNDKVLDNDKIDFYNTILNLEQLGGKSIIDLYNKLKDKDVSYMYYDDIKNLKYKSYDNVKSVIFNPNDKNDIDSNLTSEYGVDIYDYRDKEYTMLVRCLGSRYRETNSNRKDCYTLLSDLNSKVLNDGVYIYGYSDFDNDCILHIFEGDAYSLNVLGNSDAKNSTTKVNRIMTPEQIVMSDSNISEVQIVNKKIPNDRFFDTLKPSYIVAYDKVNDMVIEEAHRLNIPIVIIKNNRLGYGLKGDIIYDEKKDNYINSSWDEEKRNRYGR